MKDLLHWILQIQNRYNATITFAPSANEGYTLMYFKTSRSIDAVVFHTDSIDTLFPVVIETVENKLKFMR